MEGASGISMEEKRLAVEARLEERRQLREQQRAEQAERKAKSEDPAGIVLHTIFFTDSHR